MAARPSVPHERDVCQIPDDDMDIIYKRWDIVLAFLEGTVADLVVGGGEIAILNDDNGNFASIQPQFYIRSKFASDTYIKFMDWMEPLTTIELIGFRGLAQLIIDVRTFFHNLRKAVIAIVELGYVVVLFYTLSFILLIILISPNVSRKRLDDYLNIITTMTNEYHRIHSRVTSLMMGDDNGWPGLRVLNLGQIAPSDCSEEVRSIIFELICERDRAR